MTTRHRVGAALVACLVLGSLLQGVAQVPSDALSDLVAKLAAATSADARGALLDEHRDALSPELQKALSAKALELRRAGRLDEAGQAMLAQHDVADRRGDHSGAAMALVNYSAIPGGRADYPAALAVLNDALAAGETLHDNEVISAALANLAIISMLTGDYDRSLELQRRALDLATASGDTFTQGRLYSNIGLVYARQGHYREALEAHEKAVVLKQATSDAADVALTLLNIGNVHVEQRNYDLALDYYTRSYAQLGPAGAESAAAANALNNIGTVNRALGRYDVALDNIQRSLAISERLGNRVAVATSTYNVALVASLQGRKPEALAGYRQSLALREAINDRVGVRECLDAIANVLLGMGEREEALRLAQRAVDLAREMKSNELLWQPLTTVGDIRRQTGDPAGAEAGYRQAIDAIETMRSELAGGAESRRRFFEDKLGTYRRLTSLLIETNRRADALAVAERARGRVLTDVLDGGDVAVRPLTADERAKQRGLERDVVVTTARLANAERRPRTDPAAVKEAQDAAARLRQARLSLDELRDALDARYPVRRLARGDAQPDPVAAAAAVLGDARTAIVEFAVADEATYVFVVTRPDASAAGQTPVVSAFTVPIASNALAARVEAYRRKLASRALDFQPDARALYDLLLKPARAALAGRTRLVIVPDAALWTIPFETLAPAAGRALIDDASVSYAPSIAVLRAMHERRAALDSKGGRPRIVIAADPASDLPKLPDAQRQALSLTALYGAARSRVFIGANATEPRVRAAASEATILHFATHGVVDDTNPMYSYLQLTRTGEVDAETDGRLEAWEILSLKLDAAVAVLTACDTARGTVGGGEGVVGLAWAFFAAGTPATVVSLWPLESGSATTLTLGLHQRLRAALLRGHASVADSLRAAALELRRDPRYRHPFYWAGLVTVGDGF